MTARTGRFRRSDRLVDGRDFRRVMRSGRRAAGPDLVVFRLVRCDPPDFPSGEYAFGSRRKAVDRQDAGAAGECRLGVTASRKVGNAVMRNRFKRRVREWFRTRRCTLRESTDLVVIARASAVRLPAAQLVQRLDRLAGLEPAND